MNKPLNIPVIPRHPHRTWLTPKGEVVADHPVTHHEQEPDPARELSFHARVLDTSTEDSVTTYPELQGSITVHKNDSFVHRAEQSYYEMLRWVDSNPDIELLKRNVNAGIWSIQVDMEVDSVDTGAPTVLNG